MRPELFPDAVHEEFHTAATRAYVDVEVLAVLEQLTISPRMPQRVPS
jgi:hypothetical protein